MSENLLLGLAAIIVLGIAAQWFAWRLHLPSILLLLILGLVVGPGLGLLKPNELFGDLLFPLVSLSVAIILFEGGLSLRFSDIRQIGHVVRNLTTVGILVTWVLATALAYLMLGISFAPSALLGAILVVSGPTVIIPLLRHVRPRGKIGAIIKWEGIVNDPIGAILAVLVYEVIVSRSMQEGTLQVILGVFQAAIFGTIIGMVGAGVLVLLLKRYLIPDFLQNPVSLMVVVLSFIGANAIQEESGLLSVTVMGIVLANQQFVSIRHIVEFKESLRVLLISSLFIILAARLTLEDISLFNATNWLFVAMLIVIVRPLAVAASTIGSSLSWRERAFLAWMAPRGIVAAAVSAVFALRLVEIGYPECGRLVPLTFQVIIGTVALYGLTAPMVARRLEVASPNPQGVLFAGAQSWVREIALILLNEGFRVALVDTNWGNITAARNSGMTADYANILSENLLHDIQLDGIGRILAMTPNDEVNSLSTLHFVDIFGRSEVYQLFADKKNVVERMGAMPQHLRGRYLFDESATYTTLTARFLSGSVVKKTPLSEAFTYEAFREMYGDSALPMFIITESKTLQVCTTEETPDPQPGQTLISLVDDPSDGTAERSAES